MEDEQLITPRQNVNFALLFRLWDQKQSLVWNLLCTLLLSRISQFWIYLLFVIILRSNFTVIKYYTTSGEALLLNVQVRRNIPWSFLKISAVRDILMHHSKTEKKWLTTETEYILNTYTHTHTLCVKLCVSIRVLVACMRSQCRSKSSLFHFTSHSYIPTSLREEEEWEQKMGNGWQGHKRSGGREKKRRWRGGRVLRQGGEREELRRWGQEREEWSSTEGNSLWWKHIFIFCFLLLFGMHPYLDGLHVVGI